MTESNREGNSSSLVRKGLSDNSNTKPATIYQLFGTADSYDIFLMVIGTIGGIITGLCLPVFCILFGRILDSLNKGKNDIGPSVDTICVTFVVVGVINIFSGLMQVVGWTIAGERQAQRLRASYVRSVLSQEIGWFDTCGASELSTLVADLTGKVQDGITRRTGDLIQYIAQFVFSFVASLYLCWQLAVVLIAAFPLIAAAGTFMIKAVTSAQNETTDQYAKAGGVATESLNAIRTVTALNAQPYFIQKYREYIIDALNIGLIKSFKVGLGNGLTFFISFGVYALGFWYGSKLIADQKDSGCTQNCYTGGTIIAVFFSVIVGSSGLGQITPPLSAFFAAKAAAGAMIAVIDRKPLIDGLSNTGEQPKEKTKGLIEITDLVFAYPSRPNVSVCNGYSLTIKPGETIALCGPSGAGKSTIINLLLRFYDPISGSISLDGRDIKSLNIKWLRNSMGYVGQEPVLFAGTIAENIAYGIDRDVDKDLTDGDIRNRVIKAATLANAHSFITGFPLGYDTEVGGNGLSLSGGQKQRIAIARALVKQPAVLLLDEATSALDAASERIVQQSIDSLQNLHTQTTIIIAHRLSTIRNADKIAVIDNGRVVELGSHDELFALNGLYSDLVRLQMNSSDEKSDNSNDKLLDDKPTNELTIDKSNSVTNEVKESVSNKVNNKTITSESEFKLLRKRVWLLVLPYTHWLLIGLLGSAMVGAAFPIWGLLLAHTENIFYYTDIPKLRHQGVVTATHFVLLGIDCLIGYTLQYYFIGIVGHKIVTKLRSDLYESYMRREISFFDYEEHSVGTLTTNLSDDTRLVHESTGETFANQLQALFTMAVGLVIGFTASWKITLVVLATFPINIAASAVRMKARTGQNYESTTEQGKGYNGILSSAFTHMRTVSAFSMQYKVSEDYAKATHEISIDRQGRSFYGGIALGVSNFVMFSCYALLFWYGSTLIINGQITFVDLMTAMLALMLGALGLGQALNDIGDQKEGVQAAKRIFDVIEKGKESPIDGLSKDGIKPSNGSNGQIVLKNVCFHYPTRPEIEVCNNYNLTINPGEVVALVGPSGSGKSTIMNLLLRFYDPLEGEILLDGINIKDLNVRWLRSQIGYVGQEPVLFTGDIAENIIKGRADAVNDEVLPLEELLKQSRTGRLTKNSIYTEIDGDLETGIDNSLPPQDVLNSSRLAGAHEFIQSFTNGYKTDVGEGSVMVSGGQKQRIAIARALVKQPAVLLLDEATSALDAASERIVQQSIDSLQNLHTQTTIIIAHRLSTIRNADKIAVIDNGRVVEIGTHDELLHLNGLYSQLWEKQSGARNE